MKQLTIYLDSGHYPEQPGKRSPLLPDGRRFFEWEANYKICNEIMVLSANAGPSSPRIAYPIRPYMAEARTIDRRAAQYNLLNMRSPGPALIISIHSNAAGDGRGWHPAHGIETYYWHTSKGAATAATILQNHLVRSFGWMDRGIKPTSSLALLKRCMAPVVLTETGFFTNREQVEEMLKPEYITKTAAAHYAAIHEMNEMHKAGKLF